MWDKVIGNSYVPDMIDGIGLWFGKLGEVMVDPSRLATASVGQGFAQMALQAEEQAKKTEQVMQNMDLLRRGQEGENKRREVEKQMDLLTELENRMAGLAPAMERQFIESLQNMVKTGKFEFKDLFDFAIRQIQRMNGEFGRTPPFNLGSPGGGIGGGFPDFAGKALGFLSGFDFGGFFAHGGRVHGNRPIVVGERGPELFVPRSSGTVIPNNQLGTGGGNVSNGGELREPVVNVTLNQTIGMGAPAAARIEWMRLRPQIIKDTMSAFAGAVMKGGRFSDIIRGR